MFSEKESSHHSNVLSQAIIALKNKNSTRLRELSDMTIHSACESQDSASLTVAVILYALSKLVERGDYDKLRNWDEFVKKINSYFELAAKSIKEQNEQAYLEHAERARKVLTSQSISLKPYIQDVLKKASINKGSKIYEHGISAEQTSKMLGISQWELLDYVGQKSGNDFRQNQTMDTKKRAKMALEFFS